MPEYVWPILLIVVLAGFVVYWIRMKIRLRHARAWPAVPGLVDSTVLRLENRGNNQSIWAAEVLYSYSLQGTACSGRLRRTFLLKSKADQWIGPYKDGLPLSLRYNPERLGDSVLFDDEQTALKKIG